MYVCASTFAARVKACEVLVNVGRADVNATITTTTNNNNSNNNNNNNGTRTSGLTALHAAAAFSGSPGVAATLVEVHPMHSPDEMTIDIWIRCQPYLSSIGRVLYISDLSVGFFSWARPSTRGTASSAPRCGWPRTEGGRAWSGSWWTPEPTWRWDGEGDFNSCPLRHQNPTTK